MNDNEAILKIDYNEIPVTDMAAAKAFYRAAFGWDFLDFGPDYAAFQNAGLDGGLRREDTPFPQGCLIILKAKDLESVAIVFEDEVVPDEANVAIAAGKSLAAGVSMAKDIVNAPHNVLNSESMANVARLIAEESGGTISCTIL